MYSSFNRIYDNTNMPTIFSTYALSEGQIKIKEYLPYTVLRNTSVTSGVSGSYNFNNPSYDTTDRLIYRNCDIKGGGQYGTCYNCNIYPQPYYGAGKLKIYNSNFYNFDDINSSIKLSFNGTADRLFSRCEFKSVTELANHNKFDTGVFEKCNFRKATTISPATNNLGDIQFNNCVFYDSVSINIGGSESYLQFNNCKFIQRPSFTGYGEANSQFNNCIYE